HTLSTRHCRSQMWETRAEPAQLRLAFEEQTLLRKKLFSQPISDCPRKRTLRCRQTVGFRKSTVEATKMPPESVPCQGAACKVRLLPPSSKRRPTGVKCACFIPSSRFCLGHETGIGLAGGLPQSREANSLGAAPQADRGDGAQ